MPFLVVPLIAVALRFGNAAALLAAAASDIDRRIISNRSSIAVAVFGAVLRLISEPRLFWVSVLAAAAVFLGLAGLAHLHLLGGGDVKLAAAVTFMVPVREILPLLLDIAIAGGVLSIICLAVRRFSSRKRVSVPYGVAISAAVAYRVTVELYR